MASRRDVCRAWGGQWNRQWKWNACGGLRSRSLGASDHRANPRAIKVKHHLFLSRGKSAGKHLRMRSVRAISLTPRFSGVIGQLTAIKTVLTVFRSSQLAKTVKTVLGLWQFEFTPLKRGVNETGRTFVDHRCLSTVRHWSLVIGVWSFIGHW